MGLLDLGWLRNFAALHEAVKRGELKDRDLETYREKREEMARALLELQQITLEPGQKPRYCLRVARGLEVTLLCRSQVLKARTLNIAVGGFAAILESGLQRAEEVGVTLLMPDGELLHARARVVESRQHRLGSPAFRVGFQFVTLSEADAERLGMLVFDIILEHLKD